MSPPAKSSTEKHQENSNGQNQAESDALTTSKTTTSSAVPQKSPSNNNNTTTTATTTQLSNENQQQRHSFSANLLRTLFSPLSPSFVPLYLTPHSHLLPTIPSSLNSSLLRYLRKYGPNATLMIVNQRELVNWDAKEVIYRLYELLTEELREKGISWHELQSSDESSESDTPTNSSTTSSNNKETSTQDTEESSDNSDPASQGDSNDGAYSEESTTTKAKSSSSSAPDSRIDIDSFQLKSFFPVYHKWCELHHIEPIPYHGRLDLDEKSIQESDIREELPLYNEETYGSLMLGERSDWKRVLRRKRRSEGEYDELWEESQGSDRNKRRRLNHNGTDDDADFMPSEDFE